MFDYTASNHFSQATLDKMPGLALDKGVEALHLYFLHPKIDPDDKRIIIPAEWLATLEGVEYSSGYSAQDLLERYKALVSPNFRYSGWSLRDGKSRRVLDLGWSKEYQELVFQERLGAFDDTGKIWFLSKKKVNTKTIKYEREMIHMLATEQLKTNATNDDMLFVANYINNTPINTYTKTIQRNMTAAKLATLDIIQSLDKDAQREELRYFMQSLSVLRTLEDYPQDQYTAVEGGTSRLFAITNGIQTLARPVRKALTQGWYECDLAAAQTAINAKVWGVENVHNFLGNGGNVWATIASDIGIPKNEATKDAMKKAFYTLQYGGGIPVAKAKFTRMMRLAGYDYPPTDRFINHWIVQAMLDGRERFVAEMVKNNGAANYYGRWFSLDDYDFKTILSHVATSYELALIRPAFDVAATSREMIITVVQFDGFSVAINDATKTKSVFKKLAAAVNSKANELGINTFLETPAI